MKGEKQLMLCAITAAVVITVAAAVFAPENNRDDPRPSIDNAGPNGAKAAYVLLQRLGYTVVRSEKPLTDLYSLDAAHTTLVLANSFGSSSKEEQKTMAEYLTRGGRVVADGELGVDVLPGFYWKEDRQVPAVCYTKPQGVSALAQAGGLVFHPSILAKEDLVETVVAQSCEHGGAVITYPYGAGTAVWWASPEPLTNRGLHEDANLRLLLASLGGTERTVVFNEAEIDVQPVSSWDKTKGIPLTAMLLQLLLVLGLLVFGYGRRHGPMRTLATTPRTSPLEFAYSMGNLYHKAAAGEAATRDARERLIQVLEEQCGVSHDTVLEGPEAVASMLLARFDYRNSGLVPLLEETQKPTRITPGEALERVKELNLVADELRRRVSMKPMPSKERLLVCIR